MSKRITARMLQSKGACAEQVETFRRLWPRGVVPTEALAIEHASTFDFQWAATNLLGGPALAECERVCGPALAEYERVRGPALAEYKRVRGLAFVRGWLTQTS